MPATSEMDCKSEQKLILYQGFSAFLFQAATTFVSTIPAAAVDMSAWLPPVVASLCPLLSQTAVSERDKRP